MSLSEAFLIVPNPVVSGIIWFLIFGSILYMARDSAHSAIRAIARMLHNAMRLSAFALDGVEKRLALRNKEVLLAHGREASERTIEREFERIDATVRKELAETPSLHRKMQEQVAQIEDAYKESAEVPPSPPGWVEAVEAVAKIPAKDPVVVDILEDIHESLVNAHKTAIEEYRASGKSKHNILKNMMPSWRRLQRHVEEADGNYNSLLDRAKTIDRYMDEYQEIINGTERAVRRLSSSSLTQFFISAFVLAIAVGGAVINFHLIARPMAEMVGGNTQIYGYKTADIAALVIILVEIPMGLFLMESLRITRLFPVIGDLKDRMRIRMGWVAFGFLLALATIEAGLAYMREMLMVDELATSALLRGEAAAVVAPVNDFAWMTTMAQMGIGFILPFALAFVAIPLENFVHSMRTVLGVCLIGMVRALAFSMRILGNFFQQMGMFSIHAYDFTVFAPLWVEHKIRQHREETPKLVAGDKHKDKPYVKEVS